MGIKNLKMRTSVYLIAIILANILIINSALLRKNIENDTKVANKVGREKYLNTPKNIVEKEFDVEKFNEEKNPTGEEKEEDDADITHKSEKSDQKERAIAE